MQLQVTPILFFEILQNIQDDPFITIDKLSEKLGITTAGVRWNLRKLQKKGVIRRVGSNRSGYWELVQDES